MRPLVASFVIPLIFIGALRITYCGVLQSEVTVYEKNDVVLPCFTTWDSKVEWRIYSKFQRTQIPEHYVYDSRRIYSTSGLIKDFISTGRYSVSVGNGFYNLTIANVNMSEAGEYICHENLAGGNRSSTQLTVLVNVSTIQNYENSSAFDGDTNIHLPCRVRPEDGVIWMYIKSSDATQIVIFNGTVVDAMNASSFIVNSDRRAGYYNLTIDRVRLNLSGWFICMEYTRSIFIKTVRLTVLVNVSSFENPKILWSTHGHAERLVCHSTPFNPVRWLFIESQHAPQHVIFNGRVIEPEYKDRVTISVNETGGEYELIIRNAQFNESGWYVCIDDGTSLHINPYFLNVLVDLKSFPSPERMSVVKGRDAILPCRVSIGGPIRWLYSESDITPQYVIFNGSSLQPQYSDRVRVDQSDGDFNLSISNVQLNDSGWYICFEIHSQLVHLEYLKVDEAPLVREIIIATVIAVIVAIVAGGGVACGIKYERRRASRNERKKTLRVVEVIPSVHDRRVAGVTSLDNNLYVIRIPSQERIQVYDKNSLKPRKYEVKIPGLKDDDNTLPWERGFTSCARHNCLYASDKRNDIIYAIYIEPWKVESWKVEPVNGAKLAGPTGLSVNDAGIVIVTCFEDNTIRKYERKEGGVFSSCGTFNLLDNLLEKNITSPYHAVEVTGEQLAVSHYGLKTGVVLIELIGPKTGKVIRSSVDCKPNRKLPSPRYLARHSKKSVLVVDSSKQKIVLLDFGDKGSNNGTTSVFSLSNPKLDESDNIDQPWCLYFDEEASRLYIGEREGYRVFMFDTKLSDYEMNTKLLERMPLLQSSSTNEL